MLSYYMDMGNEHKTPLLSLAFLLITKYTSSKFYMHTQHAFRKKIIPSKCANFILQAEQFYPKIFGCPIE
jgi:hypothetical protein